MVKPDIKDCLWMVTGAVILLMVILIVLFSQTGQNPTEQLAFKATRVDLVARMRLNLASSSEAEKSAVLAITDLDSETFAGQARAAVGVVEQDRKKLEELLSVGGTQGEKDLLGQFSECFMDLQRIDKDLLDLVVNNTNLKALSLAFGPAADAIQEMDKASSRLVAKTSGSPRARDTLLLASGAQTAALRIQALLAPHIMEENDEKMDEFEALMTNEDQQVHKNLDTLAAIEELHGDPELETAVSSYARFSETRGRILALSRENTHVRSLAISLGQKRKVVLLCQEVLSSLQEAILQEPIVGVTYGFPTNPRSLEGGKLEARE